MRRKNPNTTPIGKEDFDDLTERISGDLVVEVSEDLISEILISETLWAGFSAEDSADDLGEKALRVEKISR